ncbi:histidine kinase [Litoribaculum gwangyangense]|uniref:Histidine kinase n=1 Tax=Litoribaculum gwangyangense TaxID=1130722 RepID=A0ABP9C4I8_9FLAO
MKKTRLFLLFICFGIYSLNAQIVLDSIKAIQSLVNNDQVEALVINREVSYNNVKKYKNWQPYDSTFTTSPKLALWVRFTVKNTSNKPANIYLYAADNFVDVFIENKQQTEHLKNGYLASLGERDNKIESYFTQIELPPLQSTLCYVKLSNDYVLSKTYYPLLYSTESYLDFAYKTSKLYTKPVGFIYFYLTTLCCIFVFVLVFWFRLQQRLYFYYLGYLLFQIIYAFLVLRTTTATVANIFLYAPAFSQLIFEPVQFAFIGFYIFFILNLLEINKYNKTLSKVLIYFGVFCFFYAFARFIFNYYFKDLQLGEIVFSAVRFIILPLNFVLIIWIIYKVKHPLLKYFIIGQSLFFIGSILSFYLAYSELFLDPNSIFNFPQSRNIIFQIGLLGEVYCFSIAIGENIFLLQKEKNLTSQKLIDQLQENKVLQENMNQELDKKVKQKTEELIHLYSEIEKQKEAEIKSEFTRRIQDMEMLALRSQMNPHFIFNSLNALKNLIMISDKEGATSYLDNFSVLLRSILQNSTKDVITVEEELEILELYLSLEKNRIEDSFNYTIEIHSRELLSQYNIPPLLLQPFVENAIWHGLNPSEKAEKQLTIIFDTTKALKITIQDNGIGRKASGNSKKMHKSMGTDITKERLSLFNHTNDINLHLTILDLEENGIPSGTKIILNYNQ